ncbi:unnamed protein product [Closterium sp. NIES-65]|nr:unnamed protein product [Closterium sp. NIES-65]
MLVSILFRDGQTRVAQYVSIILIPPISFRPSLPPISFRPSLPPISSPPFPFSQPIFSARSLISPFAHSSPLLSAAVAHFLSFHPTSFSLPFLIPLPSFPPLVPPVSPPCPPPVRLHVPLLSLSFPLPFSLLPLSCLINFLSPSFPTPLSLLSPSSPPPFPLLSPSLPLPPSCVCVASASFLHLSPPFALLSLSCHYHSSLLFPLPYPPACAPLPPCCAARGTLAGVPLFFFSFPPPPPSFPLLRHDSSPSLLLYPPFCPSPPFPYFHTPFSAPFFLLSPPFFPVFYRAASGRGAGGVPGGRERGGRQAWSLRGPPLALPPHALLLSPSFLPLAHSPPSLLAIPHLHAVPSTPHITLHAPTPPRPLPTAPFALPRAPLAPPRRVPSQQSTP